MKTFILKWNPAISSVSMEDMEWICKDYDPDSLYSDFNWSIHEWDKAEKGDRVFLLRVGYGNVGIMASGWLEAEPFEDKDWRGTDGTCHYADLLLDVLIYPQNNNILDTKTLQQEIPTVDWTGGHSGVVITDDEADRLERLWMKFLAGNKHSLESKDNNAYKSLKVHAWGIAVNAHKGQVDKGGKDYFENHIMKVYDNVEVLLDENENCVTEIVALLHDVVEDTDWTIERLREQGFTEEMLEALDCVTRRDDESYDDFIERLKSNRYAREVKIADLKNNMDITRLNEITDTDVERLRKYLRAYKILSAEQ